MMAADMIALDTNILARFYVEDPGDTEALKQRPLARAIISETLGLFVPLTVILELEWVLRAFYGFAASQVADVFDHLLGLPNLTVEDADRVTLAVTLLREGIDFADALHLAGSRHCHRLLTFDDRRFARKAQRLQIKTKVVVELWSILVYEVEASAASGGFPLLLRRVIGHRNTVLITCSAEEVGDLLGGTNPSPGLGRFFSQLEGQAEEGGPRGAVLGPRGAMAHGGER